MADFTTFLSHLTAFNTNVLLPFISSFFTSTVGFCFVGVTILSIIFSGVASLLKNKI